MNLRINLNRMVAAGLLLSLPISAVALPSFGWEGILGQTFCAESGASAGSSWNFSSDRRATLSAPNIGAPNPWTYHRARHGGTRRNDTFRIEEVDKQTGHVVHSGPEFTYDRDTESIYAWSDPVVVFSVRACGPSLMSIESLFRNDRIVCSIEDNRRVCVDTKTGVEVSSTELAAGGACCSWGMIANCFNWC